MGPRLRGDDVDSVAGTFPRRPDYFPATTGRKPYGEEIFQRRVQKSRGRDEEAQEGHAAERARLLTFVVIGGGLTAIDTATESLAYYVVQVEKFLKRYEMLAAEIGEHDIESHWTAEEREVAKEFLAHARAIREERANAASEGRKLHLIELLELEENRIAVGAIVLNLGRNANPIELG